MKRKTVCIPGLSRIADKCLIGDLEAFIVYLMRVIGILRQLTNNLQSSSCDLKNLSYGSPNGCEGFSQPDKRMPIEAECTACADAQFKIKHDKRREWMNIFGGIGMHSPDRDNCTHILERLFEEHLKLVHPDEYATREHNRPSGQ